VLLGAINRTTATHMFHVAIVTRGTVARYWSWEYCRSRDS